MRSRLWGLAIFLFSLGGLALGMRWQSYLLLLFASLLFLWGLAVVFLPEDYGADASEIRRLEQERLREKESEGEEA